MNTKLFKSKIMAIVAMLTVVLGVGAAIAMKAPEKKHTNLPSYYWYSVNSSGQIVAGSQAYSGDKETVSYAEDNLPCPAGTDADCVRGFNNQITSFPTSATGDTSPLQKQE